MLAKELDWANSPWFIVLCWAVVIAAGLFAFFWYGRRASAGLLGADESGTDDLCEIEDEDCAGNGDPWTVWCRNVKENDDAVA